MLSETQRQSSGVWRSGNTDWIDRLVLTAPDKIHVSIHFPESQPEVERVIAQVTELDSRGIRSGINLWRDDMFVSMWQE